MSQNAETLPMAYAGTRHAQAGCDTPMRCVTLPRQRNDGEDGRDEEQLSYLDANVEEEQRDGDR